MNFRSTLVIIIILVGIMATYFLFFNEPADDTPKNDKPRISETYDLPRKDIQKVRLAYADNAYQTLTIVKNADSMWQLTEPFEAHTDTAKVYELLDDFLNKHIKQTLAVADYDQYGLVKSTIKIELWTDPKNAPKTFLIGEKGVNYSVYIKEQSEDHIFLIESSVFDNLTKAPADIRDKSVIKFNPNSIVELQYQKPEELACTKDGDRWKMTYPLTVNADTEEIEYILSELNSLQVSTFEADGENVTPLLKKYGLDKPRIQFTLKNKNKRYELAIGAAVPPTSDQDNEDKENVYVHAIHQGGIYTVTDNIVRLFNKTVFDLRDKRVLDFQRSDTIKFEIQKGNQKIVCLKLDDTWELQGTKKTLADTQAVSDLLFGVDSLEAVAFITKPEKKLAFYGLEKPSIRVIFTVQGAAQTAELHIGNYTENNTAYVKSNVSDQITRVKRDLIDKIAKGETWLRNKQIFKFNIDDASRISVKYNNDSKENDDESFTCQRLGTNWRLTFPVKENANNAEVNRLLYELIDLRAEEFIGSSFTNNSNDLSDTIVGFNSPQMQITVELRTKKVYTLQIGSLASSSNYYARLKNQPDLIFLLNAEEVPKLRTKLEWLRDTEAE